MRPIVALTILALIAFAALAPREPARAGLSLYPLRGPSRVVLAGLSLGIGIGIPNGGQAGPYIAPPVLVLGTGTGPSDCLGTGTGASDCLGAQ
jgi:hypothetical protein